MSDFDGFFQEATGHRPYPYQRALATAGVMPSVLSIPTGLGKTAAIILAWLWRRRHAGADVAAATPRRLVYCLPMRVLVEQTGEAAVSWLHRLGQLGGCAQIHTDGAAGRDTVVSYDPWAGPDEPDRVRVFLLLGGDVERDWDRFPERDVILVGTQDLLLSRALARGYAMSRFRWPLQFGLLHSDALWVYDEVQLMGSGLTTSAQLQAFRRQLGAGRSRSIWMSATMRPEWLDTVDFEREVDAPGTLVLGSADRADEAVVRRTAAAKLLAPAGCEQSKDGKAEATAVCEAHRSAARSLVVVNTVRRAVSLYRAIKKRLAHDAKPPEIVLVHSRFRPPERQAALAMLQRGLPDLAAYLAATHHGKVRLSLRPQPGEREPEDGATRFALGIWDGDPLPATDLGAGVRAPETTLCLRYAALGEGPETGASWVERSLALRDEPTLGPFRLAYLEALLRVADWRGSELLGEQQEKEHA